MSYNTKRNKYAQEKLLDMCSYVEIPLADTVIILINHNMCILRMSPKEWGRENSDEMKIQIKICCKQIGKYIQTME